LQKKDNHTGCSKQRDTLQCAITACTLLHPDLQRPEISWKRFKSAELCVHHDALEFPDGQIVLLTRLCEGQRATVLQLPAPSRVGSKGEEQTSVEPTWSMLRGVTRYRLPVE
jgi:hypothetical protein